jgi:hypothetical protein
METRLEFLRRTATISRAHAGNIIVPGNVNMADAAVRNRHYRLVGFVWMIKAEYVAEFMDGPPGFADRFDEISCSSEACPAA